MPTVVLFDNSLSMLQGTPSGHPRLAYAKAACQELFNHLERELPLEYCSLLTFSSRTTTIVEFSQEYKLMREKLEGIEVEDSSRLDVGLQGAAAVVEAHFQTETPCQIVLFMEGKFSTFSNPEQNLPFAFPHCVHVVYIGDKHDIRTTPMKENTFHHRGGFYPVDVEGPLLGVKSAIERLLHSYFMPFLGTMTFGKLSSSISVFPPPSSCSNMGHTLGTEWEIYGFVPLNDVEFPPVKCRHIVLPQVFKAGGSPQEPDFRALFHGGLRGGQLAGVVHLGEGGFGLLCSWGELKKTNLMLSVLDTSYLVPWLHIATFPRVAIANEPPPAFSYCPDKSTVKGLKSLPSDVQKVLKLAKNIDSKRDAFFKELNKTIAMIQKLEFEDLHASLVGELRGMLARGEEGSGPRRVVIEDVLAQVDVGFESLPALILDRTPREAPSSSSS